MGTIFRKVLKLLFSILRQCALLILKYEMVASNHDAFFAHIGSDTVRYDVIHSRVHLLMYQMTFFRFLYDRVCHRMREMFFQAGCDTKQFFLLHAVERYYIGYNRFCLGQGSGLVKYDRLRLGNSLQKLAALDRNVMLACLTHRRQDCKRHCQFQCTGEINHQDRQCFRRIAGQQIGKRGTAQTPRNECICQVRRLAFNG